MEETDTDQDRPGQKNHGSKTSFHGNIYHARVLMLYMHRCMRQKYEFGLTPEVARAETFDDIELRYNTGHEEKWRFLQVKHRQNEANKITRADLLNTKKGDFSLKKYFSSYRSLRQKIPGAGEYIIYTNADFGEDTSDIVTVTEKPDLLMDVSMPNKFPKYCKIDMRKDEKIYKILKTTHDADDLANELSKLINESKPISCRQKIIRKYQKWLVNNVFDEKTKTLKTNNFKRNLFFEKLSELIANKDSVLKFPKNFFQDKKSEGANLTDLFVQDKEITDFMNELTFAVNQPNVDELGKILNEELVDEEAFSFLRADIITNEFFIRMLDWLKEEESTKHTPASGKKLYESIKNKMEYFMTINIDLHFKEELKDYPVNFNSRNNELAEFLNDTQQHKLNFVCSEPLLCTLEVYSNISNIKEYPQYRKVDSKIFIDLGKVIFNRRYMDLVEKLFGMKDVYTLLILQCNASIDAGNSYIKKFLQLGAEKKIIIISPKPLISEYKQRPINFTDLASETQRNLKNKVIKFQGYDIPLNKFIIPKNFYKIEGEFLTKLLQPSTDVVHIGRKLTKVDDLYIDRQFIQKIQIKKDILKENCKIPGVDAIIITGIENNLEIENPIVKFYKNSEWNKKMFNKDTRRIHWLKLEKNNLNWYCSNCPIKNLANFVTDSTTTRNIEELLALDEKFCIISDIAGMGKSTILDKMANELKKMHKDHWVMLVDLNSKSCQTVLRNNINNDFEGNKIEDFVKSLTSMDEDSYSVINYIFLDNLMKKTKTPVIFLIDAFDEICPDYDETVARFIEALAKLNVKNVIVTTRPHMRDKLEMVMKVFAHTLEPFPQKHQKEYLINFFKNKLTPSSSDSPDNSNSPDTNKIQFEDPVVKNRLQSYVDFLVDKVDTINTNETQFIGIPQHLKMVAEVFVKKIEGKSNKWQSCEEFLISNAKYPKLRKRLGIIDLYDMFYEKKIYDYKINKSKEDYKNLNQTANMNCTINLMLKYQQKLSLKLFFTKEEISALNGEFDENDDTYEDLKSQILKVGFVSSLEIEQKTTEFHHMTYAEYFTSKFLKNVIEHPRRETNRILFNKVLMNNKFNFIRSFLNSYISDAKVIINGENWTTNYWKTNQPFYNEKGQSILHVVAAEGNANLVDFILNSLDGHEEIKENLLRRKDNEGQTALYSAMKSGSIKTIEKLYILNAEDKDKYGRSLLYIAAFHKHWKAVKWLLDKNTALSEDDINVNRVFYYAAIFGEIEIVAYLLRNVFNKHYVKRNGILPHVIKHGQLEILKWLLKNEYISLDNDLASLLYEAFDHDKKDIIEYLLGECRPPNTIVKHILAEYNQTYLL